MPPAPFHWFLGFPPKCCMADPPQQFGVADAVFPPIILVCIFVFVFLVLFFFFFVHTHFLFPFFFGKRFFPSSFNFLGVGRCPLGLRVGYDARHIKGRSLLLISPGCTPPIREKTHRGGSSFCGVPIPSPLRVPSPRPGGLCLLGAYADSDDEEGEASEKSARSGDANGNNSADIDSTLANFLAVSGGLRGASPCRRGAAGSWLPPSRSALPRPRL